MGHTRDGIGRRLRRAARSLGAITLGCAFLIASLYAGRIVRDTLARRKAAAELSAMGQEFISEYERLYEGQDPVAATHRRPLRSADQAIQLLRDAHRRRTQGDLTDRWGEPVEARVDLATSGLAGTLHLRSAGHDGRMHTADDVAVDVGFDFSK